jgi:hypothetical protein
LLSKFKHKVLMAGITVEGVEFKAVVSIKILATSIGNQSLS